MHYRSYDDAADRRPKHLDDVPRSDRSFRSPGEDLGMRDGENQERPTGQNGYSSADARLIDGVDVDRIVLSLALCPRPVLDDIISGLIDVLNSQDAGWFDMEPDEDCCGAGDDLGTLV